MESQRDNLGIHGLKEVEAEKWEHTEQILRSMIQEKLGIKDVNIERAHRVGNTNNTSARRVVAKFIVLKNANRSFCCQKFERTKYLYQRRLL